MGSCCCCEDGEDVEVCIYTSYPPLPYIREDAGDDGISIDLFGLAVLINHVIEEVVATIEKQLSTGNLRKCRDRGILVKENVGIRRVDIGIMDMVENTIIGGIVRLDG